ncbi:hypothetical protein IQ273_08145 [Nodosilinea sp. LEGE 07298]|uniref:hypothetical protein n=1 Tax=Nodosilinea sp. LEGE 07298 TaxID=2777970 RepID=UPI001881CC34|nr:hypothetical protein [Nodosilinea sp. LEGE 07298]MBE9109386.1 hypothetical protein [Nodosilinea sp. LEGE 07298]
MAMRRLPLAVLLIAGLVACTPTTDRINGGTASPPSPSPESPASESTETGDSAPGTAPQAGSFEVNSFTVDELFAQGGGGCGMTLWQQSEGSPSEGFLFFNGLAQPSGDGFTLMKINGEFVRFSRTAAAGEEFYGQQTSQTFVSQDDDIQLQVDTALGEPGEIESVAVEGTLQLQQDGDTVEIPVQGDAGC